MRVDPIGAGKAADRIFVEFAGIEQHDVGVVQRLGGAIAIEMIHAPEALLDQATHGGQILAPRRHLQAKGE